MIKFRSRNYTTSESVLDTLKMRKLRYRQINIKIVTVIKFIVNKRGSSSTDRSQNK
jgi:hypothetical protein